MTVRLFALSLVVAAGCSRAAQVRPESTEVAARPAPAPAEVEEAPPVAPPVEEQVVERSPREEVEALAPPVVQFAFDSTELSPPERDKLAAWASFIRSSGLTLAGRTITIEGHADERGTEEYNLVLGEKRASSVRSYLERMGLDAARVRTVSYGESRPLAFDRTDDAFTVNRRAEVKMDSQSEVHRSSLPVAGR